MLIASDGTGAIDRTMDKRERGRGLSSKSRPINPRAHGVCGCGLQGFTGRSAQSVPRSSECGGLKT